MLGLPHQTRTIIFSLLLAQLLFGIGILLMLPPFEGSDETAHYSRIESVAFAPQITLQSATPAAGQFPPATFIASDVFDYYHQGPMPYGWIKFPVMHKYDPIKRYQNYRDFFANPKLQADYLAHYRDSPIAANFSPSPEPNWEYQHPGLYYTLMAPLVRILAGHASLLTTTLVLRIASFLLAFGGFCIGLWGTARHAQFHQWPHVDVIMIGAAIMPFLLPDYFWEFARLGNDSLCLFLFGIAWCMALWMRREPRSDAWLFLALTLAFGYLTKALILPITVGLFGWLAMTREKARWVELIKSIALFALVAAPLYLGNILRHGAIGAGEFTIALNNPNALTIMYDHMTWGAIASGLQQIFFIPIWLFGSMSVIIIEWPIHYPLYIFTGCVVAGYGLTLFKTRISEFFLPLCVLLPVIFGLMAHVLASWIVTDTFTPGWYLHIMAPAIGLVYGLGLQRLISYRWLKPVLAASCIAIVALNFIIVALTGTVFSGCTVPVARRTYVLETLHWLNPYDAISCLMQTPLLLERLSVLAFPHLALLSFGFSMLCLFYAGYRFVVRRA
jgi:hypothetical protein